VNFGSWTVLVFHLIETGFLADSESGNLSDAKEALAQLQHPEEAKKASATAKTDSDRGLIDATA
jgi:hypothetical protein